jgi:hypothetical protein
MPTHPTLMLKTDDMGATIAWYERAGFEIHARHPEDDPTWAEVARDDVVLQFLAGDTPWPQPPALTGTIYIHPDDVQAVHDRLPDEIEAAWGPETREWGMVELGLQDPNGYFLTFAQPADG